MSNIIKSTIAKKSTSIVGNIGHVEYTDHVETKFGTKSRAKVSLYQHDGDRTTIYYATFWGANAELAKAIPVGTYGSLTGLVRKDKVECNDGEVRELHTVVKPVFEKKNFEARVIL